MVYGMMNSTNEQILTEVSSGWDCVCGAKGGLGLGLDWNVT